MSIYNIYATIIRAITSLDNDYGRLVGNLQPFLTAILTGVGVVVLLFILQGFGLYEMAKRRNFNKKWLAFIPFGNFILMGQLAGTCAIFGRKMKHTGIYVMIAEIVGTILYASYIAAQTYLFVGCADYITTSETEIIWTGLSGFSGVAFNYYKYISYILSVVQLIQEILMFILLLALYKKYSAKNYFPFSILALFIPLSRCVVLFVLRKNKAIDYEEYIRQRNEQYRRSYQKRYGNPEGYNNPYGNRGGAYGGYNGSYGAPNPYGNQTDSQQSTQEEKEGPFGEFDKNSQNAEQGAKQNGNSDEKNGGKENENQENHSSDSDDLFD